MTSVFLTPGALQSGRSQVLVFALSIQEAASQSERRNAGSFQWKCSSSELSGYITYVCVYILYIYTYITYNIYIYIHITRL